MPAVITSRHHALVALARAAARGDDDRRLLLEGWHLLGDALAAGVAIETVAWVPPVAPADAAVLDALARRGTDVVAVTPRVMDALSPVRTPGGPVALADRPRFSLEALLTTTPALVCAAAGVQDPGNVGALIRSAEAGGAGGVLLDAASADPWGWKALRASMGSALRLPTCRVPALTPVLSAWRDHGLSIVTTDPDRGVDLGDVPLSGPCVVVLGAEGGGVPAALHALADHRLRIPMSPPVNSLNVAVAAALIVYDARRQRRQQP